ncbi:MAG: EcsC family protein [Nonlabens sp.]
MDEKDTTAQPKVDPIVRGDYQEQNPGTQEVHTSNLRLDSLEEQELIEAIILLENPGLAAKITTFVGTPIEKGISLLPEGFRNKIMDVTHSALLKATEAAMMTIKDRSKQPASNRWHKFGVALSGGIGGFFGLGAIAVELPISTTMMLRSIADIARAEGENLNDNETKLACLQVFAMGGNTADDDKVDSGYLAVRTALAQSIKNIGQAATSKLISDETAPLVLKIITKVAERFSIQVTEKAAAQAIPAIGAAGGAIVNTLFIDHYQDMAQGHFTIRRLERKHGKELIQARYMELLKTGK